MSTASTKSTERDAVGSFTSHRQQHTCQHHRRRRCCHQDGWAKAATRNKSNPGQYKHQLSDNSDSDSNSNRSGIVHDRTTHPVMHPQSSSASTSFSTQPPSQPPKISTSSPPSSASFDSSLRIACSSQMPSPCAKWYREGMGTDLALSMAKQHDRQPRRRQSQQPQQPRWPPRQQNAQDHHHRHHHHRKIHANPMETKESAAEAETIISTNTGTTNKPRERRHQPHCRVLRSKAHAPSQAQSQQQAKTQTRLPSNVRPPALKTRQPRAFNDYHNPRSQNRRVMFVLDGEPVRINRWVA
eukprot:CAMPEP_0119573010 /NCGR_PEP_ID=MMETSP1352-20130426/44909_1 /TAXON_ID=265584 /ORGANISM="Stauroneis constricta, Strain CCMP1120" /LENGTH=297 /DNA_ID=CAMNT_0007622697 /DNA_START=420 /DNA_END=1313 /DNA_ORIENTATION=+